MSAREDREDCKRRLFGIIVWLVCCTMYLCLGMAIFEAIEAENTEQIIAEKQALRDSVRVEVLDKFTKLNYTREEISKFMSKIKEAFSPLPYKWTYTNSLSFSIQTVTTIGYGYIAPLTKSGRVFCIFYALFGIPLAALLLQATGAAIFALIRCAVVRVGNKISTDSQQNADFRSLVISMVLLSLVILTFAVVFGYREGLYIEGVYGWFITLTTIGYGDVIPGQDSTSSFFIWLRVFFTFIGLSFTASVLSSLSSWIGSANAKVCNSCNAFKSHKTSNNHRECVSNEENCTDMNELANQKQDTTVTTSL